MSVYSGYTESKEKIETRKQRVLTGFQPVARKTTCEEPLDYEKAYLQLRHALLENMLWKLQRLTKQLEEANQRSARRRS